MEARTSGLGGEEAMTDSQRPTPNVSREVLPHAELSDRRTVRHACHMLAVLVALVCLHSWPVQAQTIRETIEAVQPKVVKIFGAGGPKNLAAYGTGFFVSPQGHIATVWSHLLDADLVIVVLHDGRRFTAKVQGAEPQLALAVLKLNQADGQEFPYFDLNEVGTASTGARVLGFSNMFNVAAGDEPVSVIHGVLAARTTLEARRGVFESPYSGPVYVVDAVTNNSGAAGGVLTTRDGRLLGMIGSELRNAKSNTWFNHAIPLTELRESIQQIISGQFTPRRDASEDDPSAQPRRYKPADFGFLLVPDVVDRTPAFVDSVQPNSAAAKVGLKPDDLVLFVNEELIQTCRALHDAIGRLEPGDRMRLVVRRGTELVTVEMPVPRKMD